MKTVYSTTKKNGVFTEFDERRLLGWGDFLIEFEQENHKFNRDEKKFVKQLIEQGNEYQEQLNEEWLDYGYMTFKQYASQMYRYIALQDMIIDNMKKFVENVKKYNENEK